MWNTFRSKQKNKQEWFQIELGAATISGFRTIDGCLFLETKYLDNKVQVKLDRESSDKLSDWMIRSFPRRNNVLSLATSDSTHQPRFTPTIFPVLSGKRDPEGSPPGSK